MKEFRERTTKQRQKKSGSFIPAAYWVSIADMLRDPLYRPMLMDLMSHPDFLSTLKKNFLKSGLEADASAIDSPDEFASLVLESSEALKSRYSALQQKLDIDADFAAVIQARESTKYAKPIPHDLSAVSRL
jgi:hypothetical protein